METLRDVRKRIRSVRQTLQVTNAMKLISTSKLRKARKRLEAALPYFNAIQETMIDLVAHAEEATARWFDLRKNKSEPTKATLLITADKGLAGSYNSQVIKEAENFCPPGSELYIMGNVGRRWFTNKNYRLITDFIPYTREPEIWAARELANFVANKFISGEIDEFNIVYTRMHSIIKLLPAIERLLPLQRANLGLGEKESAETSLGHESALATTARDSSHTANEKISATEKDTVVYNWMPSEARVFDSLVPYYLKGIIFGALIESFTSEQAARMTAMDSASKNAEEVLDQLQLKYNRARQAAITKEVSEIVAGASAIEE